MKECYQFQRLKRTVVCKSNINTMPETTSNGSLKRSAFIEQLIACVKCGFDTSFLLDETDFVATIVPMAINQLNNGPIWNGQNGTRAFLSRLGSMIFNKLETIIKEYDATIMENVRSSCDREWDVVVSNAFRYIDETEDSFHKIFSEKMQGDDMFAAYRQREEIDKFRYHLNTVYSMLYGEYGTDDDIEALVL